MGRASTRNPAAGEPAGPEAIGRSTARYASQGPVKSHGRTYTPPDLARFVATAMVERAPALSGPVTILDPAVGDGELVLALLRAIPSASSRQLRVTGFDTDEAALDLARARIGAEFPSAKLDLRNEDFIGFAGAELDAAGGLPFADRTPDYDFIIANPPYVRTQAMGSEQVARLAPGFGLSGRTDLYHLFLVAIGRMASGRATVGLITSNRFMTTRAGEEVRAALRQALDLHHIWDLGDTRLFDAAVLPVVVVGSGRRVSECGPARFSTIYETTAPADRRAATCLDALTGTGVAQLPDGRRFQVRHGELASPTGRGDLWRLSTAAGDDWLATVESRCVRRFRDIGKVRVGVKTCADKVFIRRGSPEGPDERPELLRPLITHHCAGRFRALPDQAGWSILYPHEVSEGRRRAVDLNRYPNSKAYLDRHRTTLESRRYLIDGGRRWYEIWVPQDPAAWTKPKLVFRDIAVRPTFWIDLSGAVVNGDCYWLTLNDGLGDDLLWLALGIANSSFIEAYYDHCFNNKLYAGRRRFMTQYVEQFPLPDDRTPVARSIIDLAKSLYDADGRDVAAMEERLDRAVWSAFGLAFEEVPR